MPDDRFISPHPSPAGLDRELLEILIEECAEVQHRITKALRFGLAEVQPGQPHDNAARIGHEVGDLLEVLDRAMTAGVIRREDIEAGRESKRGQLRKFLQSEHDPAGTGAGPDAERDFLADAMRKALRHLDRLDLDAYFNEAAKAEPHPWCAALLAIHDELRPALNVIGLDGHREE